MITLKDAEALAVSSLVFLASEPERLATFLAITGLGPDNLRAAAAEPGFLGQVLAHLMQDESAMLAFAANAGVPPARVAAAERLLNGPPQERDHA